jgi:outer membrane lipoprotein SlyB
MHDLDVIVAVFSTRGRAESAIHQLWHAGFSKHQIGILIPGEGIRQAETQTEAVEDRGAAGAVTGAIAGGMLGAVVGSLALVLVPGIGPVLTGGGLMTILAGSAAGAAAGSFAGPFLAMGLSHEDVKRYQADLRSGRTVVVVQPHDQGLRAEMILRSNEPVDLHAACKVSA